MRVWCGPLGDLMATALVDRLVYLYHIVNIRGDSDRMQNHTELDRLPGSQCSTGAG